MTLKEQLPADLRSAIFAKDSLKVSTLRMLISDMNNFRIEKQRELEEADLVTLLERQVKRHRESIEDFEKGGRAEMAEKERKELEILQTYLPEQVSQESINSEVEKAVATTGASTIADMGKVMGALAHLRGKADFTLVSLLVKKKLSSK